ncbi:Salicylate carboxymethyltransferase [Linum grandiflorum]
MASPMEVEAQVKKEGSFTINYLETKQRSWDPYEGELNLPETLQDSGSNVAKCVRAVLEPLLVRHFDLRTQIVDEVFRRYGTIVSERMVSDHRTKYANMTNLGPKAEMKVDEMLHMNAGTGETSYATNSFLQKKAISMTRPITEEAITELVLSSSATFPRRCLAIADLGCGLGPNTLFTVSELLKSVVRISKNLGRESPEEFQVFLNDLPENDFNSIFTSLPVFKKQMKKELTVDGHELSMFISAVPGSFYGRLFPVGSLHFVHSSYSLHWLSQVPDGLVGKNKGNISYGSSSPRDVFDLYSGQFRKDFAEFLRCRALELVSGGKMVLTFPGRRNDDTTRCCYILELMSITLNQMASKGLIDTKRLESLNIPVYMPSPTEVEAEVEKQGSFTIDCLEDKEMSWDPYEGEADLPETLKDSGSNVAKYMRAVVEPLLVRHLDLPTQIVDEAFRRYGVIVSERMVSSAYRTNYANVIVSLTKH